MDREPADADPDSVAGKIACVLITHPRAKLEMRRHPHLRELPVVIIDRSQGRVLVIDHFPAALGVTPGMTPEQALSRQVGAQSWRRTSPTTGGVFQRVLESLQGVSDRVEEADLGTAYVGLDGLEALYGGEARLVNTLLNAVPQDLGPRVGVGHAKFPAYAAAVASASMGATKVPTDVAGFLAPQPVDLLPIPEGTRTELHRFGLSHPGGRGRPDRGRHGQPVRSPRPSGLGAGPGHRPQPPGPPALRGNRRRAHGPAHRHGIPGPAAGRGGHPAPPGLRPAQDAGTVRRRLGPGVLPPPGRPHGSGVSTSSRPWGTGNRHPGFSGANWRPSTHRGRWRTLPWRYPASPGNRGSR